jgi:hypothetical protein
VRRDLEVCPKPAVRWTPEAPVTLGEEVPISSTVEAAIARFHSEVRLRFGERLRADYTSEFVFTLNGATEDVAAARQFVTAARQILHDRGWLDAGK